MTYRQYWQMSDRLAQLGLESFGVIGLRLNRIARGGRAAEIESHRMVQEKANAFVEAQFASAAAFTTGRPMRGAEQALAVYRKGVRANRRRLAKG